MSTGHFSSELSKRLVPIAPAEQANPYASPIIPDEPLKPPLSQDKWHLLKIHVADAQLQAMRRRILLVGDVEAEICNDGWVPNELVTVNGSKRCRGSVLYFTLVCPTIHFDVETREHRIPAFVEAKAAFSLRTLLWLTAFRIIVGGQLVYSDDGK